MSLGPGSGESCPESVVDETLGSFLRTRRDRTGLGSIGLDPAGSGRRVPGLCRDELARLAGVNAGHYTCIEQDQAGTVSGQVPETLASVMRLDTAEWVHLYNLASAPTSSPMSRELPEVPHPRVLTFSELLSEAIPVVILGRHGDVLAWNRSRHELLFGHLPFGAPPEAHRRPSIPYLFFADPTSRDLYRNWGDLACVYITYLRLTSRGHPRGVRLTELIGKLLVKNTRFAGLWAGEGVADCAVGNMLLAHPGLRHVDIDYQIWQQPEPPDHRFEVYIPNDRPSREALDLLESGQFPPQTVETCGRATP